MWPWPRPFFQKIFKGSRPDCPWKHARQCFKLVWFTSLLRAVPCTHKDRHTDRRTLNKNSISAIHFIHLAEIKIWSIRHVPEQPTKNLLLIKINKTDRIKNTATDFVESGCKLGMWSEQILNFRKIRRAELCQSFDKLCWHLTNEQHDLILITF